MSEGNNTVDFTLRTKAELAGAQQFAASLEMQIGKAKALGQDFSGLQQQLNQVNVSIKESSEKMEESGEASEFLHHNHRALHMLFHEMGRESIPAFGHALGGALMGPLGPALALLSVLGYMKSAFEEWDKALDEAGESAGQGNFAAGIDAMNKALQEGQDKIDAYAEHIAKIALHERTIAEALQSQLGLMRAIAAERERSSKLDEQLAKDEVERKKAAGEITPEQAELKTTADAIAAAKAEAARKKQEEADEIAKQQQAINDSYAKQRELDADQKAKETKVAEEKAHRERLAKDFGPESKTDFTTVEPASGWGIPGTETPTTKKGLSIDEAIKAAMENVDKWTEKLDQAKDRAGEAGLNDDEKKYRESMVQQSQEYLDRAKGQLYDLEQGHNQYLKAFSSDADGKFNADQRAAAKADQDGQKNADDRDKMIKDLEQRRANQAGIAAEVDHQLATEIADILTKAVHKLYDQPHGAEVERGVQIADAVEKAIRAATLGDQYQRTHKISEEDARFLMKFVNENGGNASTADQAADFATKNFGNTNAHETTDINDQNKDQFTKAEIYLVQLANDLGAHVNNVKAAADFVAKLKDNTSGFSMRCWR